MDRDLYTAGIQTHDLWDTDAICSTNWAEALLEVGQEQVQFIGIISLQLL